MHDPARLPPGTTKPRRFRPTCHYELLVCGLVGHELVGTDAAELRPQDALAALPSPDLAGEVVGLAFVAVLGQHGGDRRCDVLA
jgi:hypothetical protein